ncbi:helix-turn-helix domain-containing protein [Macrococcus equi]|uniref:helix-turn-helix domain-containing protein n=1 Tax=Macrococcus equi TaxID=3395462 RepID=UPI0039BEA413
MRNEEIAAAIKWHRENHELQSKDIADYLNLSPSAYSRLENSQKAITAEELVKLASFYNIPIDELLTIPSRRKDRNNY